MNSLLLLILSFAPFINAQTYCTSGPTTTVDSNLGATLLIGDTEKIDENSNCPGTIGPKDLTSLVADVSAKTYVLNTTVTSCGNSFPTLTGAWVDWNQNFIFEAEELLGPYNSNRGAISWSFQAPAAALAGKTRLRIMVVETQATVLNPCASFPYGGTKDFSIQVKKGAPDDGYCKSGPLTTDDSNLGGVQLIGEYKNIRENSDCPGQTGVQNFLDVAADVVQKKTYTISFNVTTCADSWPTSSAAWIDWDKDGVFSNTDLIVNYTKDKGLVTRNFTVPSSQYLGNTVLRVQVQETDSTKIDPCATFSYGGTKDFGIIVLAS